MFWYRYWETAASSYFYFWKEFGKILQNSLENIWFGWIFDKVIRCRPARTYSREKEHVSGKTKKVTIIVENKGMCTGQKGKKVQLWAQLSFFP